jgi:hypothetical protein
MARTDGAAMRGSVFLRNGFSAELDVRLLPAEMEGDLESSGATTGSRARGGGQVSGSHVTPQPVVTFVLCAVRARASAPDFAKHQEPSESG